MPVYRRISDRCTPWPTAARISRACWSACVRLDDLVELRVELRQPARRASTWRCSTNRRRPANACSISTPSRTREEPDAVADEPGGTGAGRASITRPRWSSAAAGGRWSVRPPRISSPPATSWRSWTILAIGLLVTGCSAAYTWSATTRTERIQRLVDQRTAELRKKDDQLRQSQKLEAVGARWRAASPTSSTTSCRPSAATPATPWRASSRKSSRYQDLQNVLQAADRAASLTRQLLSFSRRQTVERKNLRRQPDGGRRDEDAPPPVGRADRIESDPGPGRGNRFRRRRQLPASAVEPVPERPRRHAFRRRDRRQDGARGRLARRLPNCTPI